MAVITVMLWRCLQAPLAAQTVQDIDALTAPGRIDEARTIAKAAANHATNQDLPARTADLEDRCGSDSPRYYNQLVEAMRATGQPESDWRKPAERGILAPIRGRQTTTCQWFAALIASNLCGPDIQTGQPPDRPRPRRPQCAPVHGRWSPKKSHAGRFQRYADREPDRPRPVEQRERPQ